MLKDYQWELVKSTQVNSKTAVLYVRAAVGAVVGAVVAAVVGAAQYGRQNQ